MGPGLARLVLISRRGPASLGSLLSESIAGSPTKYLGVPSIQPRKCGFSPIRECHTTAPDNTASTPSHLYKFHPHFPEEEQLSFLQSFLVLEDVVTEDEEVAFMKEMEPHLKRHIYEKVTKLFKHLNILLITLRTTGTMLLLGSEKRRGKFSMLQMHLLWNE